MFTANARIRPQREAGSLRTTAILFGSATSPMAPIARLYEGTAVEVLGHSVAFVEDENTSPIEQACLARVRTESGQIGWTWVVDVARV